MYDTILLIYILHKNSKKINLLTQISLKKITNFLFFRAVHAYYEDIVAYECDRNVTEL